MSTLLALLFAFFSLISLLSVNPTWDTSTSQLGDNPSRMSEAPPHYDATVECGKKPMPERR